MPAASDNGNRSDVVYEAFTDPFAFSLDAGADIGKDHYESMGRVTGTVTVAGAETGGLHQPPPTQTEVAGWAYQDHSWGPRHWGMLLSHRWIDPTPAPTRHWKAWRMRRTHRTRRTQSLSTSRTCHDTCVTSSWRQRRRSTSKRTLSGV